MKFYLARRPTNRSRLSSFTGAILNSNSKEGSGETEWRHSD